MMQSVCNHVLLQIDMMVWLIQKARIFEIEVLAAQIRECETEQDQARRENILTHYHVNFAVANF